MQLIPTVQAFFGRNRELDLLRHAHSHTTPQLVVLYGRRRIGKSTLLKKFLSDKPHLFFEGLEGQRTPVQIEHFKSQLSEQTGDSRLKEMSFQSWDALLSYLTDKLTDKGPMVLVFDELQWMAARRTK